MIMTITVVPSNIRGRYCRASIYGQRITRMEETGMGGLYLSGETAWILGTSNLGLFVGASPTLDVIVRELKKLGSSRPSPRWIVIAATKRMAAVIAREWSTPTEDDFATKAPKLPTTCGNITLATPESLKKITGPGTHDVAAIILLDMLCHVHRARRMRTPGGFAVDNDRPQMIADFRNSLLVEGWAPPLIIVTEEPARAVHADYVARAYCLDGFWFMDGKTFAVSGNIGAAKRRARETGWGRKI
jgi:hypothetical protein